jgi:hypothetical protein
VTIGALDHDWASASPFVAAIAVVAIERSDDEFPFTKEGTQGRHAAKKRTLADGVIAAVVALLRLDQLI